MEARGGIPYAVRGEPGAGTEPCGFGVRRWELRRWEGKGWSQRWRKTRRRMALRTPRRTSWEEP